MRLYITGSIAFDTLMSFPGYFKDNLIQEKLESLSVSFLVDSLNRRRGGCAANIAYSLALLGENPMLIGAVGKDFDEYGKALKKAGVDVSGVLILKDDYTASFFATTDRSGNQIASFYPGAMGRASEIDLKKLCPEPGWVIVSPDEPGAMLLHAAQSKALGYPTIFDPSQQIVRLSGKELVEGAEGARILVLNEYEMELFTEKTGLKKESLLKKVGAIIVTLGKKGAAIHLPERTIEVPAVEPERIQDPTGVGDAFRSGILKGLTLGMDWEVTCRMGSLAACYVLETDGPQSHHYTLPDFLRRYEKVFGPELRLRKMV